MIPKKLPEFRLADAAERSVNTPKSCQSFVLAMLFGLILCAEGCDDKGFGDDRFFLVCAVFAGAFSGALVVFQVFQAPRAAAAGLRVGGSAGRW